MVGTWRKRDSRTGKGHALGVGGARRGEGGSVRRIGEVDVVLVRIAVLRIVAVDVGACGQGLWLGGLRVARGGYMRV